MIRLCDRFKVLPSQLLAEDVRLLKLMKVYDLMHPKREEADDG